jgi:hypothetical protein
MAPRLLRGGLWYEPISSRSVLESDYEQTLLRYSADIFPGYVCVQFKATVQSHLGNAQPDLVLIDSHYRSWTVVEVELEHHSFSAHVEPQMRKLISGRYTEEHGCLIASASEGLDQERVCRLVVNSVPDFLVVVPSEMPGWRPELRNMGSGLAIVQVFINGLNDRIILHNGDRPASQPFDLVTRVSFNPNAFLPRAMKVASPASLPEGPLRLEVQGFVTTWRVVTTQQETFILPDGTLDLDPGVNYRIIRRGGVDLVLEGEK